MFGACVPRRAAKVGVIRRTPTPGTAHGAGLLGYVTPEEFLRVWERSGLVPWFSMVLYTNQKFQENSGYTWVYTWWPMVL